MGLPGAGKTYLAKEIYKHFNAIRINGDEVRKNSKIGILQKKEE